MSENIRALPAVDQGNCEMTRSITKKGQSRPSGLTQTTRSSLAQSHEVDDNPVLYRSMDLAAESDLLADSQLGSFQSASCACNFSDTLSESQTTAPRNQGASLCGIAYQCGARCEMNEFETAEVEGCSVGLGCRFSNDLE